MTRYRLVTQTGSEQHVSSVILSADEARQHLLVEETMHRLSGWDTVLRDDELICVRPDRVRTISVRETGPFDDFTREGRRK